MSQTSRILLALALGLALGIGIAAFAPGWATTATGIAQPIGTAWLNGLQMTIVPLVMALLVTGVAAGAEAARAGRLTARAIVTFIVLLWIASALASGASPASASRRSVSAARSATVGSRKRFSGRTKSWK